MGFVRTSAVRNLTLFAGAAILASVGLATEGSSQTSAAAMAHHPQVAPATTGKPGRVRRVWREVASFYANRLRGKRTESGERYDPEAMTAASRTLPIGSQVVVTN